MAADVEAALIMAGVPDGLVLATELVGLVDIESNKHTCTHG